MRRRILGMLVLLVFAFIVGIVRLLGVTLCHPKTGVSRFLFVCGVALALYTTDITALHLDLSGIEPLGYLILGVGVLGMFVVIRWGLRSRATWALRRCLREHRWL